MDDTEPRDAMLQHAERQTKALESINTVLIALLLLAVVFAIGVVIRMAN